MRHRGYWFTLYNFEGVPQAGLPCLRLISCLDQLLASLYLGNQFLFCSYKFFILAKDLFFSSIKIVLCLWEVHLLVHMEFSCAQILLKVLFLVLVLVTLCLTKSKWLKKWGYLLEECAYMPEEGSYISYEFGILMEWFFVGRTQNKKMRRRPVNFWWHSEKTRHLISIYKFRPLTLNHGS